MKSILVVIFIIFSLSEAKADRWEQANTRDFYSPDSSYFVRVVPRYIPSNYSKWKNASPRRKQRFSAKDTVIVPCYGQLFKISSQGDSLVWEKNLVNSIAPVYAIISDDGQHFVTFDNWGGDGGYGTNAVVIYGPTGQLMKRYNLEEISPYPIDIFWKSVTAIRWRCRCRFISKTRFELCFVTDTRIIEGVVHKEREIHYYNILDLELED